MTSRTSLAARSRVSVRCMRTIALLISAFTLTATTPGLAQADTPGCVSRAEFRKVQALPHGEWRMRRVHRLFDTSGDRLHYTSSKRVRAYRVCTNPRYGRVEIEYGFYHVWLVEEKHAHWG